VFAADAPLLSPATPGFPANLSCEPFLHTSFANLSGKRAVSTGRSLERLESRGSCKVTELDDLAPFLVDEEEEEALGLQTIPSEREKEEEGAETSNGAGEIQRRQALQEAMAQVIDAAV
jgi:hypothetical protein